MLLPRSASVRKSASVRRVVVVSLLLIGAASIPSPSRFFAASAGNDGAAGKSSHGATLKTVAATAADIPFNDYDAKAEQVLLDLANQARTQAGWPRLTLDAGLCRAARAHAEAMFAARRLSHQFEGEPPCRNAWWPRPKRNWIGKAKMSRSTSTPRMRINTHAFSSTSRESCSTRLIT